MNKIVWKLEDYLQAHGKTRYELAQVLGGNLDSRLASIYRLKNPLRLDFSTLADLVGGLRELTGEKVTPNDLLEYVQVRMPEQVRAVRLAGMDGFSDTNPADAPSQPFVWYSHPLRDIGELRDAKSYIERLRDSGQTVDMQIYHPGYRTFRKASESPDVRLGNVSNVELLLRVEIDSWTDML